MITLPHDTGDLLLAPVVLSVSSRIEELGRLTLDELAAEVALTSDCPDWTRPLRKEGLLKTICVFADCCHGWELEWDPWGLRMSHSGRSVVLGVPPQFTAYLSCSPSRRQGVS